MVWVVFLGYFWGFLSYMYAILMCERENFIYKKMKNDDDEKKTFERCRCGAPDAEMT